MLLIASEVALSTARVPECRVGRQTRRGRYPCCAQGPAGSFSGARTQGRCSAQLARAAPGCNRGAQGYLGTRGAAPQCPASGSCLPRAARRGRNRPRVGRPGVFCTTRLCVKTSNLESFRHVSSSFPLSLASQSIGSSTRQPAHTTIQPPKHTQQQAAISADTSDLINPYEPLWCRVIPSYECLLVGLPPSSSNLPVQMTWPFGRGLLPSFETDLATWYGSDCLRNHGLSRMPLLT